MMKSWNLYKLNIKLFLGEVLSLYMMKFLNIYKWNIKLF